MAEQRLAAAMTDLTQVERRYFALPSRLRESTEPDWYIAAQQAEAAASEVAENVYRQIAQTRADTPAAILIKVRLLAAVYGDDPDAMTSGEKDEDLASCLIRSLVADLA